MEIDFINKWLSIGFPSFFVLSFFFSFTQLRSYSSLICLHSSAYGTHTQHSTAQHSILHIEIRLYAKTNLWKSLTLFRSSQSWAVRCVFVEYWLPTFNLVAHTWWWSSPRSLVICKKANANMPLNLVSWSVYWWDSYRPTKMEYRAHMNINLQANDELYDEPTEPSSYLLRHRRRLCNDI